MRKIIQATCGEMKKNHIAAILAALCLFHAAQSFTPHHLTLRETRHTIGIPNAVQDNPGKNEISYFEDCQPTKQRVPRTPWHSRLPKLKREAAAGVIGLATYVLAPVMPVLVSQSKFPGLEASPLQTVTRAVKDSTSAKASIFKPYNQRKFYEKTGNVPVYFVTMSWGEAMCWPDGNPYEPEPEDLMFDENADDDEMHGQWRDERMEYTHLFFLNHVDALQCAEEFNQVSHPKFPASTVTVTTLDQAMQMTTDSVWEKFEWQMLKEIYPNAWWDNSVFHHLDEDEQEVNVLDLEQYKFYKYTTTRALSNEVTQDPTKKWIVDAVQKLRFQNGDYPLFYVRGLKVKHEWQKINPLFFDIMDLVEAWEKARKKDPSLPVRPMIEAIPMIDAIESMVKDEVAWADWGFVPSKKGMKFIKESKKDIRANVWHPLYGQFLE